jgi:hypothetical protein
MMPDNRSPLMKRLAEIMPKKPEPKWEGASIIPFRQDSIRRAADLFASWMGNERLFPANDEELLATLWVFGEMLNGEMERMLNVSNRLQSDLLATMPFTQTIQLSDAEAAGLSKDWPGIRVEAGRYQATVGKALNDCKVEGA